MKAKHPLQPLEVDDDGNRYGETAQGKDRNDIWDAGRLPVQLHAEGWGAGDVPTVGSTA